MGSISQEYGADHRRCDALFETIERAVNAADWAGAEARIEAFRVAIGTHMHAEEAFLFPAIERREGGPMFPVEVMRQEHDELRGLIESLAGAIAGAEADAFTRDAETLRVLLAEHNDREEAILYALADQLPEAERAAALGALAATANG